MIPHMISHDKRDGSHDTASIGAHGYPLGDSDVDEPGPVSVHCLRVPHPLPLLTQQIEVPDCHYLPLKGLAPVPQRESGFLVKQQCLHELRGTEITHVVRAIT